MIAQLVEGALEARADAVRIDWTFPDGFVTVSVRDHGRTASRVVTLDALRDLDPEQLAGYVLAEA